MSKQIENKSSSTRNDKRRNGKAAKKKPGQAVAILGGMEIMESVTKTVHGYSVKRWEKWSPEQREAKTRHAETRPERRSAARAARRQDASSSPFFRGRAVDNRQHSDNDHLRQRGTAEGSRVKKSRKGNR